MTADLWVLPSPSVSRWFANIDWYLNWQLCKGLKFEPTKASVELFRVMEEGDFIFRESPHAKSSPLLTLAQGRIPAERCLVIEAPSELEGWLRTVHANVDKLRAANVRIFLPKGVAIDKARSTWTTFKPEITSVEFTLDSEAP